jgi:predicted esterase
VAIQVEVAAGRLMRHFPLAGAVLLLLAGPAPAQPPKPGTADFVAMRYELAQRMKRFEAEWERHENPESRRAALAALRKAAQHFFDHDFGEAARAFDLAGFALVSDDAPSVGRQWAWSLFAVPEVRVIDGGAKELTVTIKQLYPVKGERPKFLEVQLWFSDKQITILKPDKFPLTVKVPMPPLGEFKQLDRRLYFMAESGKEIRRSTVGISQVADLQARLAKLTAAPAKKGERAIEDATLRGRAKVVARAADPKRPDFPAADLPYAEFLVNAERMLDGKPFFGLDRPGQFWLSVPTGRADVTDCRVFVPRGLGAKKPVPVVVALHASGLDENAYFERYGAGQIVKECRKRGWLLVSPRGSFNPDILEVLGERYPIDPKRVFLVGHSLGGSQALAVAAKSPKTFAGVAVLASGGFVRDAKAFADLPFFLAVGEKDPLSLRIARELNKDLTAGSAKRLTYKEYPHVEHLVIVREALPDVFAMFDEAAK